MKSLDVLSQVILKHNYMHPARMKTLRGMIIGMMKTGKSLQKSMAEGVAGDATMESKTHKVQDFLREQLLCSFAMGKIILDFLKYKGKFRIVIDRTNWEFGKTDINYFVASIVIGNTAIPICWILLDSKGISSTEQRIQLMEMVFQIIDPKQIECLLGDREFVGEEWFDWLDTKGIPFVIRVRENFLLLDEETNTEVQISSFFKKLKKEKTKHTIVNLWGKNRTIAVKRLKKDDELLILISNYDFVEEQMFDLYRKRWGIETIFKSLKTKGFNIEGTHMINHERLSKLFFIATLAAIISIKSGLIRHLKKPIPIKKHGRRLFSLFTYGYDFIRFYVFTNTSEFLDRFLQKVFALNVF